MTTTGMNRAVLAHQVKVDNATQRVILLTIADACPDGDILNVPWDALRRMCGGDTYADDLLEMVCSGFFNIVKGGLGAQLVIDWSAWESL